jgi:ATP-dependent DNA helicase RecQ
MSQPVELTPDRCDVKTDGRLRKIARDRFGYERLWPGQERGMSSVLDGRDTLVVMPTGSGKSAIYQVTTLLLEGPAVVVSPLIALQRDQVASLDTVGDAPAAQANSTQSKAQRERVLEGLEAGSLEFLLLAPEQFSTRDTLEELRRSKPSLLVVDEAHCISAWGHDFRPEYLRLGAVAETIGRPPILALTATASPVVRDEIIERLGMKSPEVIVTGFDRPNLHLEVQRFSDRRAKRAAFLEQIQEAGPPGIVYVARRRSAEELAGALWERGVSSVYYHGAMTRKERDEAQRAFMNDEFDVVVATTAFGMGIDKPNIRFVWHFDIPDSIDSLYQEIGRAGRDGEPARAVLLYASQDLGLRRFFAASGTLDAAELKSVAEVVRASSRSMTRREIRDATGLSRPKVTAALAQLEGWGFLTISPEGVTTPAGDAIDAEVAVAEAARAAEAHARIEDSRVEMVRTYAETADCRRELVLDYFGEPFEGPCGNCDNCERGSSVADRTDLPFDLNARVVHEQWGEGSVVRYEGEKVFVLFDDMGYKSLSLDVVDERGLLKPA